MRIGVYVGTFDPVHIGHIKIINHLLNNDYIDKIIVIPTGNYWNKKNITNVKDRINMLEFYQSDIIIINDNLNNIPYTYQILIELKKEYIDDELYLVIGADNLEKFFLWEKVDVILKNKILVLPRNDININNCIKTFKNKDKFIVVKDFNLVNVSATNIKNNSLFNKNYLDAKVIDYIINNKLYSNLKRNINNVKLFVNNNNKSKDMAKIVEKELLKNNFCISNDNYDLGIAIGGDGSFLRMIKANNFNSDIYYVGINSGTLGFAQEIAIEDVSEFLVSLNNNDYKIEEIGVQETNVITIDKSSKFFSLNEIVIRESELNTLKMNVEINDIQLEKFVGDGLLVATSFGSTAYNLSFGGSIVYDTLHTLQITPIAPLNNKSYRNLLNSFVIPQSKVITFKPIQKNNSLIITVDGENIRYNNINKIETYVLNKRVKCIRNNNCDFSRKVNEKLLR